MSVLGLPLVSFLLLFVLPVLVLAPMFYYSWRIKTGERE
jgi:hypothetical protein